MQAIWPAGTLYSGSGSSNSGTDIVTLWWQRLGHPHTQGISARRYTRPCHGLRLMMTVTIIAATLIAPIR